MGPPLDGIVATPTSISTNQESLQSLVFLYRAAGNVYPLGTLILPALSIK